MYPHITTPWCVLWSIQSYSHFDKNPYSFDSHFFHCSILGSRKSCTQRPTNQGGECPPFCSTYLRKCLRGIRDKEEWWNHILKCWIWIGIPDMHRCVDSWTTVRTLLCWTLRGCHPTFEECNQCMEGGIPTGPTNSKHWILPRQCTWIGTW